MQDELLREIDRAEIALVRCYRRAADPKSPEGGSWARGHSQ